ncbi:MAG: hypothetical protein VKJ04_06850 [Vampirovibrionales bacterium]|nr:hypothetical protein [Vampirovibrionales bacterium]
MSSTSPLGQNQQLSPAEQQLLQQLISASGSFDPGAAAQQPNPYATQTPYADLTPQDVAAFNTAAAAGGAPQAQPGGAMPGAAMDPSVMDPSAMMAFDPSAMGAEVPAPQQGGGGGKVAAGVGAGLLGTWALASTIATHRVSGAIATDLAKTMKAKLVINPWNALKATFSKDAAETFAKDKENFLKPIKNAADDAAEGVQGIERANLQEMLRYHKDDMQAALKKYIDGDDKALDTLLTKTTGFGEGSDLGNMRLYLKLAQIIRGNQKTDTDVSKAALQALHDGLTDTGAAGRAYDLGANLANALAYKNGGSLIGNPTQKYLSALYESDLNHGIFAQIVSAKGEITEDALRTAIQTAAKANIDDLVKLKAILNELPDGAPLKSLADYVPKIQAAGTAQAGLKADLAHVIDKPDDAAIKRLASFVRAHENGLASILETAVNEARTTTGVSNSALEKLHKFTEAERKADPNSPIIQLVDEAVAKIKASPDPVLRDPGLLQVEQKIQALKDGAYSQRGYSQSVFGTDGHTLTWN